MRLLVHDEATANLQVMHCQTRKYTFVMIRLTLKYSFVAMRSPCSPKTENRMPFGCVASGSTRQSMSLSMSYLIVCVPLS